MAYRGPERRTEPCPVAFDCPLEGKVNKMFEDIYFGDGPENPPFTTRMLLVEKTQAESGKIAGRIEKIAVRIGLLLLATLLTGLADIVVHAFVK